MLDTFDRLIDVWTPSQDLLPDENVYVHLNEVPLDDIPVGYEDGDDSILAQHPGGVPESPLQVRARAAVQKVVNRQIKATATRVVPFSRTLQVATPYMHGRDVFAIQRALAEAGERKWGTFTYSYGAGTKRQVASFQHKHGLRADGQYGPTTHLALKKYFDAYGAHLMTQMTVALHPDPRAKIVAYATFGYNQRYKIHYTQGPQRMYGVKHKTRPPGIPVYEDCSSFATWTHWGAGAKDPNGFGYNGFGYTGTLALHGERTTNPRAGDLAFYGYYPFTHVTICIGNGKAISHGSEIGPLLVNAWYRPVSQFRNYF